MSGRSRKNPRESVDARADIARRDHRIAELEGSQRRLQHLYDISKLLTCFQSFERTVPDVVVLIADTLPLRSAIFILETGDVPQMITWQGAGESAWRLQVAQAKAQQMYRYLIHSRVGLEREEATTLEIQQSSASATEQSEAAKDFVMLPLAVAHGSIFGALQIEGTRTLEESDLFFIDAVVNQLAIALDRHATDRSLRASEARLGVANRELREALAREQLMARTDGLTGLNNRRYFFELAKQEWAVAQRYGLPLALMLFDVDHFKQFNDTVGHQMGDEILRRVARVAADRLRAADVLARYGGEEFIVLLPGSAAQQALVAAESIREAIAAETIEARTGSIVATISIGLADALPEQDTLEQLIQRADRALYRAKAKGRNCTEVDLPVS